MISGISFLHRGDGSAPQPKDKKAENTRARKRPADNIFDLEQRFKKTAKFFSKLIESI